MNAKLFNEELCNDHSNPIQNLADKTWTPTNPQFNITTLGDMIERVWLKTDSKGHFIIAALMEILHQ